MDGLALGAEPKSRIPLENVFNNTPTHQPKPRGRPPVSKPSSAGVQTTLPKGRVLRPPNPPSTLDDSMGSSAITVTDGRRRAALRIKARIQEERRLGIRKKKLSKAELARKSKKQFLEKPPWNDDNAVGGDGVNGEKAFRQRSLNQKISMRENKRQVAIKKAIVEFERRGDEENRGGAVRLSTASGLGFVPPPKQHTAPRNLNVRHSTWVYSDMASRTHNDPVIKKSFTDRSNGTPLRTRYMSSPRQSIEAGTNPATLVTRATSPFDADKLRGLGFAVPKEDRNSKSKRTVVEKEPDFIDIPEYKERRHAGRSRSPSPGRSKLQLQQQQEVASLASAIENLSSMIGGMQQQQQHLQQQQPQFQQFQQSQLPKQESFPPPTPLSALATTPIPQTPNQPYDSPFIMSHPDTAYYQQLQRPYEVLPPQQYDERRSLALQKLERYLSDMLVHEKMVETKMFEWEGREPLKKAGVDADGKNGRFMADDILQMEEVLKRYDADTKQSPTRTGEILFEPVKEKEKEKEGDGGGDRDSTGAEGTPIDQPRRRADEKDTSERIDLNIDCDKSMVERINRYRRDFARHREVGEASLLNSGYQQWQVVEVISDDLVKKLVDAVAKEVDDTMRKQAETIVNKL
ncbi:hypothetical protein TrVE_jg12577 [Triparma verrucosa]|uniref:Uncharacterized protein n=1 Tax=Triparma verrucosa TaxID=1606542 RepID=A0A9W7FJL4_9STRA|nr:hypothetical protein TrVE_jg12577 [Triparma verrucosa]